MSLLTACLLLLTQWLLAVHACAQVGMAASLAGGNVTAAQPAELADWGLSPAGHGQCSGHGPALEAKTPVQEALCQAHCSSEPWVPVPAGVLDATEHCSGWMVWLPAPAADASGHHAARATGPAAPPSPGARPGWPPLYLTLQVLRN